MKETKHKKYGYFENNYQEGLLWQQIFRFAIALAILIFLFGHLFSKDNFYILSLLIVILVFAFFYYSFNIHSRKSIGKNYQLNLTGNTFSFSNSINVFCKMWQRHISMPSIFKLPINEITQATITEHENKQFPDLITPRPKSFFVIQSPFWQLEFDNNIENSEDFLSEINKDSAAATLADTSISEPAAIQASIDFKANQDLYNFQRNYMYAAMAVLILTSLAFILQVFIFDAGSVLEGLSSDVVGLHYITVYSGIGIILVAAYVYYRGKKRLQALSGLQLNILDKELFFSDTHHQRLRKYFPAGRFDLTKLRKVGYIAIIKNREDEQNDFLPEYFELDFSDGQKIKFHNAFENDQELFDLLVNIARKNYLNTASS